MRLGLMAAGVAGIAMLSGCSGSSLPEETRLDANLSGAQEVPPVSTLASGRARVWYNRVTNTMTWTIDYQSLSGPITAAHFHGPAAPGTNAGVQIPIVSGPAPSPISGAATITQAQQADLLAGRYYINIHTQQHPGGEIRGQVTSAQ